MKKDTWMKLHTSLLMSEKFRFLPTNDHRLTYILLLLLQKKGLISQPDEFVSAMVFVSKSKLKRIKKDLFQMGLLDESGMITNFEDMQLSPEALKKRRQRQGTNNETNTETNEGTCPGTNHRDSRKQKAEAEKRGRNPIPEVGSTTKGPSFPSTVEESPSESPTDLNNQNQRNQNAGIPTREQDRMLDTMSKERSLDLVDVARDCGVGWPIRSGSVGEVQLAVSTMKKKIMELGDLSKTGQKAYKKRMELDRHWEKVESNIQNPERVAREIETVAESEPKVAMTLLVKVVDWMRNNSKDGFGGSRIVATWDTLTNLPAAYRSAGIGPGTNPPKEIDPCCAVLAMEK